MTVQKLNRLVAPAGTPVTTETVNLLVEVINALIDVVNSQIEVIGRVVTDLDDLSNQVDGDGV